MHDSASYVSLVLAVTLDHVILFFRAQRQVQ